MRICAFAWPIRRFAPRFGSRRRRSWNRRSSTSRTVVINARRLDFGEGRPFILLGVDDVTVQRRIERYERVLAEVSELVTVTLDARALVEGVAQLMVPVLADWVIVDTRDDAGVWTRGCVLHRNEEMQDAARRIAVRAFSNAANPVFGVLESG